MLHHIVGQAAMRKDVSRRQAFSFLTRLTARLLALSCWLLALPTGLQALEKANSWGIIVEKQRIEKPVRGELSALARLRRAEARPTNKTHQ
jgi:hypothetical protein